MQPVSRATVQAFYAAYGSRDPKRFAAFLDDDIEWLISGPIDVLPFCGQRRGKAAVIEVIERIIPSTFKLAGFYPETVLIDGDCVATLSTLTGILTEGSRTFSYRIAHFLRFRDDKVIVFRSIIDSFDAAEQVLGHAIDTSLSPLASELALTGDCVAI
jgi:ketosteroid isomerase-like protein